jgi:serine protease AprX
VLTIAAVFILGIPLVATASNGGGPKPRPTFVAASLLKGAKTHPNAKVPVIITSSAGVSGAENASAGLGTLNRKLGLVNGVSVTLPAKVVDKLSQIPGLTVTPDVPMKTDGSISYSTQLWPYESGVAALWGIPLIAPAPQAPTIAVIDSGIQASRTDFAGRVVADVNLSTLPNNTTPGDGRGHGTFVAGIAAGNAPGYAGAAPNAKIASLDVMDDTGVARTSDVIAACQWILANKAKYGIRVANLSMHSSTPSNFTNDPLDRAVEQLWFNGVTVVAAAGNYGTGSTPSRVPYAPGNDPFVITVGAADMGGTFSLSDDTTAPWSAYGYTYDGFWKPEIGAPGRYIVGPVPVGSTLTVEKAANVTSPGYIQLSGTSFAAPVVAGAAAQILARHPTFTPDQVKGALMLTARKLPLVTNNSLGLGEVNALAAALVSRPPNPNAGLDKFITTTSSGTGSTSYSFDAVGWADAAKADVSWDAVAWSDVAWDDVAWGDVAWGDVSWEDVSTLSDVAWGDVSWQDVSHEDAAEGDAAAGSDAYALTPEDAAALESDPNLAVPADSLPPADASLAPDTSGTSTTP